MTASRMLFDDHDFVRWLRTQPPAKRYIYIDPYSCPIAQYFKTKNIAPSVGKTCIIVWGQRIPLPGTWDGVVKGTASTWTFGEPLPDTWDDPLNGESWTFGEATQRAEKAFAYCPPEKDFADRPRVLESV